MGERATNLRRGVEALGRVMTVVAMSRVHETEPMYLADQPRFLNAVAVGLTDLPPRELLSRLKALESVLGRTPGPKNGPRVIDLDLLFYGSLVLHERGIDVPHPAIAERRFVLVPLAEVRPRLVHPELRLEVAELLVRLPGGDSVSDSGAFSSLRGPQRP